MARLLLILLLRIVRVFFAGEIKDGYFFYYAHYGSSMCTEKKNSTKKINKIRFVNKEI
jgi:hypothetical protein